MTRASATTEHRIRGQIGQPAACMIESKGFSCGGLAGRWGARCGAIMADRRRHWPFARSRTRLPALSTESVDNFVGKRLEPAPDPRHGWRMASIAKN